MLVVVGVGVEIFYPCSSCRAEQNQTAVVTRAVLYRAEATQQWAVIRVAGGMGASDKSKREQAVLVARLLATMCTLALVLLLYISPTSFLSLFFHLSLCCPFLRRCSGVGGCWYLRFCSIGLYFSCSSVHLHHKTCPLWPIRMASSSSAILCLLCVIKG